MPKNNLAARVAEWEKNEHNKAKTKHHRPGSQKK
jgi:hypothetical protein